jgi:hypothetical protein
MVPSRLLNGSRQPFSNRWACFYWNDYAQPASQKHARFNC